MYQDFERDSFFLAYIRWHYGKGLRELMGASHNFLWFVNHFFSFKLLSRTLFHPWKRLGERYEGGIDIGKYASAFVVNMLMRAVGFVTKMVVLTVGATSYLFVAGLSFISLIVWFFAPAVLIGSIVLSVTFFAI